jgi:hypothetical protein
VLREAGILIEKQSATSLNFGLQMWIDAALGSWRNTYLETRMEQCILLSSGILMSCRLMNTSRLKTRAPTNDRPPRDGLSRRKMFATFTTRSLPYSFEPPLRPFGSPR